jgi:metal transporter CNNM
MCVAMVVLGCNRQALDLLGVAGLLLVKRLIVLDPEDRRPVKEFSQLRKPVVLHPDVNLLEVLNIFQRGHCHLAIVTEQCAPRH